MKEQEPVEGVLEGVIQIGSEVTGEVGSMTGEAITDAAGVFTFGLFGDASSRGGKPRV